MSSLTAQTLLLGLAFFSTVLYIFFPGAMTDATYLWLVGISVGALVALLIHQGAPS